MNCIITTEAEINTLLDTTLCVCGHSYREHIQDDWRVNSKCNHEFEDGDKFCDCKQFDPAKTNPEAHRD